MECFSEAETLLLLTLWQRPQEHFNRICLWHPYTLTFDVIPYTLKTLDCYFPGIIRVCGPRSGFSVVIRFETKSVIQNIHALVVVVIHTPPLSNKRYEAHSQDELYYIGEWSHYSVHVRKKWKLLMHTEFKYCILRDESFQQKQPNQWNTYSPPPLNKPGKCSYGFLFPSLSVHR